jgi:hypothetical protein
MRAKPAYGLEIVSRLHQPGHGKVIFLGKDEPRSERMLAFQFYIREDAESRFITSAVKYPANFSAAMSKSVEPIDGQTAEVLHEFQRVLDGDAARVFPNGSIERRFLRYHTARRVSSPLSLIYLLERYDWTVWRLVCINTAKPKVVRYKAVCMPAGGSPLPLLLCCVAVAAQREAVPTAAKNNFSIQIVEGDGAINSIRLHRGHEPLVRLATAEGKPISGATVTFLLPATGASGSFGDGGLSLTVTSAENGTAAGRGLRPNGIAGQFSIRVIASWNGLAASAILTETNAEPTPHAGRSKKIAIAAAIAGAAIGGVAAAVAQKSGSGSPSSTGSSAPGSISSGTPIIGPPH